jgi:hypothetical protein
LIVLYADGRLERETLDKPTAHDSTNPLVHTGLAMPWTGESMSETVFHGSKKSGGTCLADTSRIRGGRGPYARMLRLECVEGIPCR